MGPRRRRVLAAIGLGLGSLAGCSGPGAVVGSPASEPSGSAGATPRPMPADGPFGFTHLRADGNRVLEGTGALPAEPASYELGFEPAWLAGLPDGDAALWAVVGADGSTRALRLADRAFERGELVPESLPPGVPPVLANGSAGLWLLGRTAESASTLTHPFPIGDGRALVVSVGGDVLLWDGSVVDRLSADALPDARLVQAAPGTYAVLAGATQRYDHGALGDDVEAGALIVFEVTEGGLNERARTAFDGPVVEGLLPIASRIGGQEPLLIVTLTDATDGARLAAFDLDGRRVATGPAIGTGFRWRHQLAVAPFGPDGEPELAVVKTPHIGGVVEFYRLQEGRLTIDAELAGYSTHAFGSRNLDGALAADLDGDGRHELLVPTQDRRSLAAVRHEAEWAVEAWRLPLGGELATNVAGVTTEAGRAVVAAATADGTLHAWG